MSDDEEFMDEANAKRLLYANVALGFMEVVGERDGEPLFRLTEAGIAQVEAMLRRAGDAKDTA